MSKELKDIFKGLETLKVNAVDYTTPEKERELKSLKKEQEEILKQKEVNWHRLNQFIFNI